MLNPIHGIASGGGRRYLLELLRVRTVTFSILWDFLPLNLPYTHREIDCLLSRFHGTNREIRGLIEKVSPCRHSRSAPSRGALLTGRYAFHTGLRDLGPEAQASELPRGFLTLADHLKSADYATHALGRWLLGDGNWTATPLCR
eukprot:SAG31_NODE_279_length_18600_cov_21.254527_13_plen_144_part_00